jgi:hypothetical protein
LGPLSVFWGNERRQWSCEAKYEEEVPGTPAEPVTFISFVAVPSVKGLCTLKRGTVDVEAAVVPLGLLPVS